MKPKNTGIKTALLILSCLAMASILFFTVGSIKRESSIINPPNCIELERDINGDTASCKPRSRRGIPLAYLDINRDSNSGINTYNLVIDIIIWLIISGVIVLGAATMLPVKTKK